MRVIQRTTRKLRMRLLVGTACAALWSYSACATTAIELTHAKPLHPRGQQDAQASQVAPGPTSPAPSAPSAQHATNPPEAPATGAPSANTLIPKSSAPKTPDPTTAAKTGTPAVVVDGKQIESVLGKKVQSAKGDDMGRIVDIIVDKSGQVRAAIIDFGGFLGVGSRQIAVAWNAIHFPMDGKTDAVEVGLTLDQLRVAPIYKPGEQIVVLGQPNQSTTPKTDKAEQRLPASAPNPEPPNATTKELPAK
jgi:hypothetical protein